MMFRTILCALRGHPKGWTCVNLLSGHICGEPVCTCQQCPTCFYKPGR